VSRKKKWIHWTQEERMRERVARRSVRAQQKLLRELDRSAAQVHVKVLAPRLSPGQKERETRDAVTGGDRPTSEES